MQYAYGVQYGCPFAHLLSAHTYFSLKNFIDIIIAAHVSFEVAQVNFAPQLWYFSLILRRTSDFHGRTSDLNFLLISFNIPLHIFWIPVYACRCPPFVRIVAKVAERQKTASPIHVTKLAQIGYAAPAGTAAQAEYFISVRTTLQ